MEYYSPYKDRFTQRDVEPLGLLLRSNQWYLAGWCRMRTDYRMFRIDRIEQYRSTGIRLPEFPEHTLKEFYDRSLREEEDLHEIVVWFDRKLSRYMGDQKYYHGWVSEIEVEGGLEITFLSASLEYMARWLLTWGNGVEVKEPEWLKNRMRELAEELYRHHGEN